jgi:cellulose synthase/poly-beta-1,6-N-acetylglucosamine synthase-like glycosyltransferase
MRPLRSKGIHSTLHWDEQGRSVDALLNSIYLSATTKHIVSGNFMTPLFHILSFVLVAITLPLVLELLLVTTASMLPKSRQPRRRCKDIKELAVIVPAHNEEQSISECVKSLHDSAVPGTTIYVVAHNCCDATAEQARTAGAEVLVYNDPTATGKGHVLRYGFEYAINKGADAVLVVDADSTVSSNLILNVFDTFASGAEVLQCRYEMHGSTERVKTELISLALRGFNFIRPLGRTRLGLSAGILGNGFAIAASVLKEIPYDALSVVEDLEYHLQLVTAGKCVAFLPEAVVSSTLPESSKGETVQHSRWEGGRLRVARTWLLQLFHKVAHGQITALEPMLDLAGLPISFAVIALLTAACIPVGWVRIYALVSISIILMHVLAAVFAGPKCLRTLRLLVVVPFYLIWKMRLVPSVLRASSAKAAWVRTDRKPVVRSAS